MKITQLKTEFGHRLNVTFNDGRQGVFDVTPYLECEVFRPLKEDVEFQKIKNGGYYVEWACGADLSADTLAAHLRESKRMKTPALGVAEEGGVYG